MSDLPPRPGCYALVLRLSAPVRLTIGALGTRDLAPGLYVYCGSAQGPGGLRARVGRHVAGAAGASRPHWHVDALRRVAAVEEVWLWPGAPRAWECTAARLLAAIPGAVRTVPRFGSSDCRCAGHLIRLPPAVPGAAPPPVLEGRAAG